MANSENGQGLLQGLTEQAFAAIDKSEQVLRGLTVEARQQHELRSTTAVNDIIFSYFKQKHDSRLNTEEMALLHYCMSVGSNIPSQGELVPRLEAAEKAVEVIEAADMLYVPGGSEFFVTAEPQSVVKLSSEFARPENGFDDHFRFSLKGLGWVPVFSLIGKDDLATPIDTAKGVDDLFAKGKTDVMRIHTDRYGRELGIPLIAGREAVARYAVCLGTQIPIEGQTMNLGYSPSDQSLYGMAIAINEIDPFMAGKIVEEVRDTEPTILNMIIEHFEKRVHGYLESSDSQLTSGKSSVGKWLKDEEVRLFFSDEQLEAIKEKLLSTYEQNWQTKAADEVAAFSKILEA